MRLLVSFVCLIAPPQTSTNSSKSLLTLESNMVPVWHSRAKNLDRGESRTAGSLNDVGSDLSHSSAWILRVDIQAGLADSVDVEGPESPSSSSVVLIFRNLPITASPEWSARSILHEVYLPSAAATKLSAVLGKLSHEGGSLSGRACVQSTKCEI
jgi:hypothetical protein